MLLDSCEDKVLLNDSLGGNRTLLTVEKLPIALEIWNDKTVWLEACDERTIILESDGDRVVLRGEGLANALEYCNDNAGEIIDEIAELLIIVIPVVVGVAVPLLMYMLSLLPAPHSSLLFPMHGMLQSVAGATTALAAILLPQ